MHSSVSLIVLQKLCKLSTFFRYFDCFASDKQVACILSSLLLFCFSYTNLLHSSVKLIVLFQLCEFSAFFSQSDCFASAMQVTYIHHSIWRLCISYASYPHTSVNLIVLHQPCKFISVYILQPIWLFALVMQVVFVRLNILIVLFQLRKLSTFFSCIDCFASVLEVVFIL
jgi:hypothetical protein